MEEIADYLYQQDLSNEFVLDYMNRFETWLDTLLYMDSTDFATTNYKKVRCERICGFLLT